MDYPIHIDTISMDLSILYFKGLPAKYFIKLYPDLGLSCLPKYLFTGVLNEKS